MKVKIKKLDKNAVIPSYAKPGDAGMDLVCTSCIRIGGKIEYGTGLAFEIPEGYMGLVYPRSSIHKMDLMQTNGVGIIDSGYRGEVKVVMRSVGVQNGTLVPWPFFQYEVGDRIAQIIIVPFPMIEFEEAEELTSSERGEGGYGSTGK